MLGHSDDFKLCDLRDAKYCTTLEVMEGILQCLKECDPLPTSMVKVDNEWNVTFKSHDDRIAITVPVAQTLRWLTREKTIRPVVQMNALLTSSHKHVTNGEKSSLRCLLASEEASSYCYPLLSVNVNTR